MIKLNDVLRLAKPKHSLAECRSVVFDGQSAMTAAQLDWVVGVPCLQPGLSEPVVVPVDAITAHLLKSRHLVVMPDHLSNGQGLRTPFNKPKGWSDALVMGLLPQQPEGEAVSFDLELNALDRVLIAAGAQDIRYYLNGVMFDLTEGMLVGCDGHRLHVYRNRVPQAYPREVIDGVPQGGIVELVLGRAPLDWIVRSQSPSAKVTFWNALRPEVDGREVMPQTLVQTEDAFVWVRQPIVGKFPDWRRVVPAELTRPVVMGIDPVALADTVAAMGKLVKLTTKSKSESVKIDFGRGLVMGCREEDVLPLVVNLTSDRADIDLAGLGADLWIGVNAPYLQDLADCVTGGARWSVGYPYSLNGPVMAVDGDFSGVVMPLRYDDPVPVSGGPQADHKAAQDDVAARRAAQEPEEAPAEPCPAAVDAMAAQLVAKVRESAKRAPGKGKAKRAPIVKDEPVPA